MSAFRLNFSLFLLILAVTSSMVAGKLEIINPAPGTPSLFAKCLAPLASYFWKPSEPVCSINEFTNYSADDLMKLDGKQISSLPASYFESLKLEQAAPLSPGFITQLQREQALAFPKEAADVLNSKSRKMLKKIKNKPGPVARAVIMLVSALTAFVIFKYS